ncbi:MAG: Serine acetyltransferase [Myxococcaceae bacterium]|nr:Serine acetyltransferase [Myxococcaceae bacterium]
MTIEISVVVATFDRAASVLRLLDDLSAQTVPASSFEVIVVDDGSREPVRPLLEGRDTPFALRVLEQENAGPAAARDRGIQTARGEIIVIVDDDMSVADSFLAVHLARHREGHSVVLGYIRPAPNLARMALFERFHAHQLAQQVASYRGGRAARGVHVCTGNVSFRRADYLAVGGFDKSLGRSEDRDLGIRLELAGAKFVFAEEAASTHNSDHADLEVWLKRAFLYGVYDARIGKKHEATPRVDVAPWRFFFLVNPVTRPFLLVAVGLPDGAHRIARRSMQLSSLLDRLGFEALAIRGTTFVYGMEYFRGVRTENGSLAASARALLAQWRRHRA